MWANSITFRPARGPTSAARERRLLLVEKSLQPDLEILGAEAEKSLVDLVLAEQRRIGQAVDEFLVPAGHQRRAVDDALRLLLMVPDTHCLYWILF